MLVTIFIFNVDKWSEEELFFLKNVEGLEFGYIKLFLLLYTDDSMLFSETADGLQNRLNCLFLLLSKMEIDGKYSNNNSNYLSKRKSI